MAVHIDPHHVLALARSDECLSHQLRAFSGAIRIDIPRQSFEITFNDGVATTVTLDPVMHVPVGAPTRSPDVIWEAPTDFWVQALGSDPQHRGLAAALVRGLTMTSDHESPARALLPGWARLYEILQNAAGGPLSNAASA